MKSILPGSLLWQYLSPEQRILAGDGAFLVTDSEKHRDQEPTDYSYMVFPFAKMYEGFLKQLFRDVQVMDMRDYYSDHFRIGKALSPHMAPRLGVHSIYTQFSKQFGKELTEILWQVWKEARNLVFHYFPHNYRALTRGQAVEIIDRLIDAMESAVAQTHVRPQGHVT